MLKHELMYYFKNKQELIYLYSFFVSIILLVPLTLEVGNSQNQVLGVMSLWIALACTVSLGAQNLYKREYDQGRLEYLQMLPISMESVVAAKWFALYLFVCLPLVAALPVVGVLYQLEWEIVRHYAFGLLAGAAGLSILASLVSALTVGLEKAAGVTSLIMLPLSIPLMIFGAGYCRDISSDWQPGLLFLIAFSVFMLPVLCFAGRYAIRASN